MGYIAFGATAVAIPALWFVLPFMARRLGEMRLRRVCRARRAIVLSYDDGPGASLTPRLLDLLGERGAKATFCMVGHRVENNPDMAARVLRAGHEVAGHTQRHFNAWKTSPTRVSRDLRAGQETTVRLGGNARLMRPPFGKLTLAGLIEIALLGIIPAWWTVDSRDSWGRRPIESVIAEIGAKGGGVVLMHDYDMHPEEDGGRAHLTYVLTLTERILTFASENGYRVMTMGEVLRREPASGLLAPRPEEA
jgi:peptidoglycan/xylan/chitin deacetylase (PgdA/CDA1 family)